MVNINPLYLLFYKGRPLSTFLIFGGVIGFFVGIVMPFTDFFFFNTFPLKIILPVISLESGDTLPNFPYINDYITFTLFVFFVSILYHTLLGVFAGFLSNVLLCFYKNIKIEKKDNNINYLDYFKTTTKIEIIIFLVLGVILTCLAVAIPSYYWWYAI